MVGRISRKSRERDFHAKASYFDEKNYDLMRKAGVVKWFLDWYNESEMYKEKRFMGKIQKNEKKIKKYVISGLVIGVCMGIAYGMVIHNMAIGLGIGLCFGSVFGSVTQKKKDSEQKDSEQKDSEQKRK